MLRISSMAPSPRVLIVAALTLLVTACAPTRVDTMLSPVVGSPPPQMIVVQDFVLPSDGAVLDRGVSARFERVLDPSAGSAQSQAEAAKTADALVRALVQHLVEAGLPAVRGNTAVDPGSGTVMIVTGQLLRIDEGNRTRRNLIGFGAGRSDVAADVQVYTAHAGGRPQLLQSFTADAQSGRKPGAAATAGIGDATGRLAESAAVGVGASAASELLSASTEADAQRMGKEIAKKITALVVARP
jgi:hypothetical protein